MEIAKTVQFNRSTYQQTTQVSEGRGEDTSPYIFQWLLYKPQLHAVEPFQVYEPARAANTTRENGSNTVQTRQ